MDMQCFCQLRRQSGFPYPGRTYKQKRTYWSVRCIQSGIGTFDGGSEFFNRLILPDNMCRQVFLQCFEFFCIISSYHRGRKFHHLCHTRLDVFGFNRYALFPPKHKMGTYFIDDIHRFIR